MKYIMILSLWLRRSISVVIILFLLCCCYYSYLLRLILAILVQVRGQQRTGIPTLSFSASALSSSSFVGKLRSGLTKIFTGYPQFNIYILSQNLLYGKRRGKYFPFYCICGNISEWICVFSQKENLWVYNKTNTNKHGLFFIWYLWHFTWLLKGMKMFPARTGRHKDHAC